MTPEEYQYIAPVEFYSFKDYPKIFCRNLNYNNKNAKMFCVPDIDWISRKDLRYVSDTVTEITPEEFEKRINMLDFIFMFDATDTYFVNKDHPNMFCLNEYEVEIFEEDGIFLFDNMKSGLSEKTKRVLIQITDADDFKFHDFSNLVQLEKVIVYNPECKFIDGYYEKFDDEYFRSKIILPYGCSFEIVKKCYN